ncbi:TAP-like protein-domain-containing protein [Daedaleopsis nitida]|nr:TAP-like protein-domain-containing protein [Daedaleopsis nitida]
MMLPSSTVWPVLTPLLAVGPTLASSTQPGEPKLEWGPCDASVITDPLLDCGFLSVPLDYHDPAAGNARIAVARANATGEKRGTVFYNPGGPDISGLGVLNDNDAKNSLLSVTGGVYDIVSWDPRGVGTLTIPGEVYCFDSVEEYNAFYDGTIELTGIEETGNFTDPADIKTLLSQAPIMQKKYLQLQQKCLSAPSGKFLRYMGTAAAVRDMVSMANILDGPDAPVNYIGISYGSLIGSWFVNMFPERVGRVLIDGIIDPATYATQETSTVWNAEQYESADDVYKGMVTGCALTGPQNCAAASEGDGPLEVDAKFQALITAAHDATRKNASVPLTSAAIRQTLNDALFVPTNWSNFINDFYPQAVAIVEAESGQSLSKRSDSAKLRRDSRAHGLVRRQDEPDETRSYTFEAVLCGDSVDIDPHVNMTDVFEAVIKGSQTVSHMFNSLWPSLTCSFWPVRSVERYQGPFNKALANKILIASSKYDPVTPLSGAQELAGLLGDDAALVLLNGFGHTSDAEPSECLNAIYVAYMVNGTLPANNTVCEADDVEVYPGVTTKDIVDNLPSSDV